MGLLPASKREKEKESDRDKENFATMQSDEYYRLLV